SSASGNAEARVQGLGSLLMALCVAGLTGCAVRSGQAIVCACLFVLVTDPAGQPERGDVVGARIAGQAGGEECLAEAVERLRFAGLVAHLPGKSNGLLVVIAGLQVASLHQAELSEVCQGGCLADRVTGLAEQGQRPLQAVG